MFTPGPFVEIERVENLFETLERVSLQVGSGRPQGERSEQWGAIVVLSRSALEEALWRLHEGCCELDPCEYTKIKFDSSQYAKFLDRHGELAVSMNNELHISLREKRVSNQGGGTGEVVDGPLNETDILRLLDGLNHIRNGFDHHDAGKVARLPDEAEGLFWVASNAPGDFRWSVQKPHAFSVLRYCRLVYLHAVLSWYGEESALASRSSPPTFLSERPSLTVSDPVEIISRISDDLRSRNQRRALDRIPLLQESIVHYRGDIGDSNLLFEFDQAAISEPIRGRLPKCLSEESVPDRDQQPVEQQPLFYDGD